MVQSVSPALPHLTSVCSHGAIFLSCLELSSFGVSGACQDTWIYNAPHIIEIISYNSIVNPAHSGLFLKSSMKTQVSYESKEVVARIGWRLLQSEAWRVIATNHPLESGRTMPWHDIMSLWCLRLFLIETKNGSPLDSIYPTSAQFYDCTIPRSHHSRLNCQKTACSTSAEGPERAAGRNDEDPVHRWQWGRA